MASDLKTQPTPPDPSAFGERVNDGQKNLTEVVQSLPKAQRDRILAVAERTLSCGRDTAMKLQMKGDVLTVGYTHPQPEAGALLLMADLGSMDQAFFDGIAGQVARIGAHGSKLDETNSNFLLSVVRAVQPKDELEAMLAVQMAAIHAATMMLARRLNHVETLPQQDSAERALNKLARTYAVQMATLKNYRTGGQQRVVVEHVTVNAGGQAIVGAAATGGGEEA